MISHDIMLLYRINDIQNVTVAMETLVKYFDPTSKNTDERTDGMVTIATI